MRTKLLIQCCAAIVLSFFHSSAYGKNQDLAQIEHVVVEYIKQQHPADATLNIELQRLDTRLKLSVCDDELMVNWSPGSRVIGRTTLGVSCASPKPWRIFVRASVEKESLTWVLNTPVQKGDVLTRQLVSQQSVMLGQGAHFGLPIGTPIVDIEPWLGQVFVHTMQDGRILGDKSLQLPNLVSKGDPVSIVYRTSQVAIKTKGIALESGALQQKISVKNSVSNKVFDAIVVGRSNVAISP